MARGSPVGRLLALLAVGLGPWIVLAFSGQADLLFSWGAVRTTTWHVLTLDEYLFERTMGFRALPPRLQAWPVATALYACAALSALSGVLLDREDGRVTAGLVILAAVSTLRVALGFAYPHTTPLPVGSAAMLALAWWYYGDDLAAALPASGDR